MDQILQAAKMNLFLFRVCQSVLCRWERSLPFMVHSCWTVGLILLERYFSGEISPAKNRTKIISYIPLSTHDNIMLLTNMDVCMVFNPRLIRFIPLFQSFFFTSLSPLPHLLPDPDVIVSLFPLLSQWLDPCYILSHFPGSATYQLIDFFGKVMIANSIEGVCVWVCVCTCTNNGRNKSLAPTPTAITKRRQLKLLRIKALITLGL